MTRVMIGSITVSVMFEIDTEMLIKFRQFFGYFRSNYEESEFHAVNI